jgi:hypothetical protein
MLGKVSAVAELSDDVSIILGVIDVVDLENVVAISE